MRNNYVVARRQFVGYPSINDVHYSGKRDGDVCILISDDITRISHLQHGVWRSNKYFVR